LSSAAGARALPKINGPFQSAFSDYEAEVKLDDVGDPGDTGGGHLPAQAARARALVALLTKLGQYRDDRQRRRDGRRRNTGKIPGEALGLERKSRWGLGPWHRA
jgi:hypothetical protein